MQGFGVYADSLEVSGGGDLLSVAVHALLISPSLKLNGYLNFVLFSGQLRKIGEGGVSIS